MDNNRHVVKSNGNAAPLIQPLPQPVARNKLMEEIDFLNDEQIAREVQSLEEQLAFAQRSLRDRRERGDQMSYNNYQPSEDSLQSGLQSFIGAMQNKPVVLYGVIATAALAVHYYFKKKE
jgi:hypothetical protein